MTHTEGKVQSASDGKPTDVDLDGRVTQVSAGTIVIDSCLTPSACGPKLSTLTISAIDLPEKPVPVDALVHVRYHAAFGGSFNAAGAVGQHVVIQNAPTLGTETNLVRSTEIVWLTVDTIDGGAVDVPAGIDPLPLGQVESACGAFPPVYALTLTPPGGKSLAVLVGETGVVNLTGVLQGHYTLRNLNDEADESGNHRGYWVVGT